MVRITDEEALTVKLALLIQSIDLRLHVARSIADEAREKGDKRWRNVLPQIQQLEEQHAIVARFLENREGIDFNDPPPFICEILDTPILTTGSQTPETSIDPSDLIEPEPIVIGCKVGEIGARTHGRGRHHSL